LPKRWSDADRDRATAAVREAIGGSVTPAYARLARFIEDEYLSGCRESVGLWDSPDGDVHYAFRARMFTTTRHSPDEIHQIGLDEMAKIHRAMEAIRARVGFPGDLKAFFAYLKSDPKFRNTSAAGIVAGYWSIFEAIDARLPALFGRLPRTDYGI